MTHATARRGEADGRRYVGPVGPPLDRRLFPAKRRWAYLNHAGVNAFPTPVAEAIASCAAATAADGSEVVDEQDLRVEEVRAASAAVMGVGDHEVAFVKNTTEGLGFVAQGLDWAPGDRVVVPDNEFPSTIYPWLALADRGVVVDRVVPRGPAGALPVEAYSEVVGAGPPPRLVVASWVQFGRGWRTDLRALAQLAHSAGALLCVDAIQGLGVLPASFGSDGVDFACADAHKWLLGPSGIGVLYVAERCLDLLRPLEAGWASVAHRRQWDNLHLVWDDCARRLEGGSQSFVGVYGLGAALDLLNGCGIDRIWDHVDRLTGVLATSVADIGAELLSDRGEGRSGIVTFSVPGADPEHLVQALRGRGVIVSPRGGGLRASPHGFNDEDDVGRLVDAVRQVALRA